MDIAESIPGIVPETIVVVVGDDTFPAAYEYRGSQRTGEHEWVGTGVTVDDAESIPQWDENRILGVFFPPTADAPKQTWKAT